METGGKSFSPTGDSTLGIGDIRAIFQSDGKVDVSIQAFIICVNGEARSLAADLMNLTAIWSAPVEESDLSSVISLITWLYETCIKLNVTPLWMGRESTRPNSSLVSSGFVHNVRSVVVAKCMFRLFGSIRSGRGLGLSTRCITLHTSLGRVGDRAVERKALLV